MFRIPRACSSSCRLCCTCKRSRVAALTSLGGAAPQHPINTGASWEWVSSNWDQDAATSFPQTCVPQGVTGTEREVLRDTHLGVEVSAHGFLRPWLEVELSSALLLGIPNDISHCLGSTKAQQLSECKSSGCAEQTHLFLFPHRHLSALRLASLW